jgi:hypothetical protein
MKLVPLNSFLLNKTPKLISSLKYLSPATTVPEIASAAPELLSRPFLLVFLPHSLM